MRKARKKAKEKPKPDVAALFEELTELVSECKPAGKVMYRTARRFSRVLRRLRLVRFATPDGTRYIARWWGFYAEWLEENVYFTRRAKSFDLLYIVRAFPDILQKHVENERGNLEDMRDATERMSVFVRIRRRKNAPSSR